MTKTTQAVGGYGERLALRHLIEAGMTPVARNWRCRTGEVDLILWDGEDIVFCEVKTRRTATFGPPAQAVVPAKARRLRRLAAEWIASTGAHPREVRFDVVSVLPQRRGPALVTHLRGAF